MFENIVCAVDGSDHALKAAEVASALASKFGSRLTLLTVTKEIKVTPEIRRYLELEHLTGEPQYVLDDMTKRILEAATRAARDAGVSSVKTEVRTGPPARTIVDFARRNGADAIVLGSRGLGDLEGALLGSVSHKVANLAAMTVIAVK
ncbi:MAG: universal stress protein [Kiloniellales bacterium]|nr:universal stress protein [Kiloniellales bacterium]